MRSGKNHVTKILCTTALSVIVCLGLAGCSSNDSSQSDEDNNVVEDISNYFFEPVNGTDDLTDIYNTSEGVSSTVNGVDIGEKVITAYIDYFRSTQGYDSDEDWANWIITSGYDSIEDLRDTVVEYYDDLELIIQAAAEYDATLDEDEAKAELEEMRDYYGDDWEDTLKEQGLTEGLQQFLIELSLLQESTANKVAEKGELEDTEATDDEVLQYIQYYTPLDGAKRSSHILFAADDEQTAQEVLDKIKSGELSFEDAAKEYSIDSSAEDGGDVGWDDETTFVTEYQNALDELDKGEVSDLVNSSYGIHIIKCTDVLDPIDGDEITSLDQISSQDYLDYWRDSVSEYKLQNAFNNWMAEYAENSDIEVNNDVDFESFPYYVDLSAYEVEDEGEEEGTTETDQSGSSDSSSTGSSDSSSTGSSDSSSTGSSTSTSDNSTGSTSDNSTGSTSDNSTGSTSDNSENSTNESESASNTSNSQ